MGNCTMKYRLSTMYYVYIYMYIYVYFTPTLGDSRQSMGIYIPIMLGLSLDDGGQKLSPSDHGTHWLNFGKEALPSGYD